MKGALHSGNVCSRVMEVNRGPTSRGVDNVVDQATRHTQSPRLKGWGGTPSNIHFFIHVSGRKTTFLPTWPTTLYTGWPGTLYTLTLRWTPHFIHSAGRRLQDHFIHSAGWRLYIYIFIYLYIYLFDFFCSFCCSH